MRPARRLHLALALLPALLLPACEDAAEPVVPGTVLISLATPAADEGAAMVTLRGPGITDVRAANSSHQLFWRLVSDEEARVVILGPMTAGPLLTAQVADVNRPHLYTAEVAEIAARDGALRSDTRGYAVTFSKLSER